MTVSAGRVACLGPGNAGLTAGFQATVYGLNCFQNLINPTTGGNVQVIDFTIAVSAADIRPSGTGGTTTSTVTVQTNPPTANVGITLSFGELTGSGGHFSHSGTRPLGILSALQGTTGADGAFQAAYSAPIFGGDAAIFARVNGAQVERGEVVRVRVSGLGSLASATNYNLVGSTTTHPDNHYGTSTALTNLPMIANDYRTQFYGQNQIPDVEKLRYNDMSLVFGGKFEIAGDWGNGAHAEHRLGINCDVGSNNVPTNRHQALEDIFRAHGSANFLNEGNHWHLRF